MAFEEKIEIMSVESPLPVLGNTFAVLALYMRQNTVYCCETFIICSRKSSVFARNRIIADPEKLEGIDIQDYEALLRDEALLWAQSPILNALEVELPKEKEPLFFMLKTDLSKKCEISKLYALRANRSLSDDACEILAKSECRSMRKLANVLKQFPPPFNEEDF